MKDHFAQCYQSSPDKPARVCGSQLGARPSGWISLEGFTQRDGSRCEETSDPRSRSCLECTFGDFLSLEFGMTAQLSSVFNITKDITLGTQLI